MDFKKAVVKTASKISSSGGKKCLVFMHDDPDGLTSGVILNYLLKKSGAEVTCRIPLTMELEKFRIEEELKKSSYDMLFIVDKATMGYYSDYPDLIKDVVIIDHHSLIGEFPSRCTVCNPSIPSYSLCSTSLILNMIATELGSRNQFIDFQTLVGLKSDWAIDPAVDFASDVSKSFYDEAKTEFPELFKKIPAGEGVRMTMFEAKQKENTTLLNLLSEFFFALSGGGFQYFYPDRVPEVKSIGQPEFTYDLLADLRNFDFSNLAEFIDSVREKQTARKLYQCYLDDWNRAVNMFDNTVLLENVDGTSVYLFLGLAIPLMPMVGSVKLYQLGNSCALVMVNYLGTEAGIHFSFRANSDKINWGTVAAKMTEIMTEKFGHKGIITGGGHPRAAEFRTRSSGVSLNETLKVFFEVFTTQRT
ncbi:MAG: DHH family phosphoesterase [Elusimicrobiota bacterium]